MWGFEWQVLTLQVRKHEVIRGSHCTACIEQFLSGQIPWDFMGEQQFPCDRVDSGTDREERKECGRIREFKVNMDRCKMIILRKFRL